MDITKFITENLVNAGAFVLLYAFIFLLAKLMKDILTPYKLDVELADKDNLAISFTISGYFLATAIIFFGALTGPTQGLIQDLLAVGTYSLLGLVLLNISRIVNDKIILRKFCNIVELSQNHNTAVGAVQFGTYIATGLIIAGSISGTGGGTLTAVAFFALGQITLLLFSFVYDLITPYNIHDELEKKNTAAGVAFGGTMIALGIIVMNAVSGNFVSWEHDITLFGFTSIVAFIFLPVIRIFMNKVIHPGDNLNREITEDKNIGAGLLEAVVAISFSLVLIQAI
jgi:uncharacterized membrane protein YjfL (UPF0719 family)